MLSRADERFGFMTPQQPIKLGANTDKVYYNYKYIMIILVFML